MTDLEKSRQMYLHPHSSKAKTIIGKGPSWFSPRTFSSSAATAVTEAAATVHMNGDYRLTRKVKDKSSPQCVP